MRLLHTKVVQDGNDVARPHLHRVCRWIVRLVAGPVASGIDQDEPIVVLQGIDVPEQAPYTDTDGEPRMEGQWRPVAFDLVVDPIPSLSAYGTVSSAAYRPGASDRRPHSKPSSISTATMVRRVRGKAKPGNMDEATDDYRRLRRGTGGDGTKQRASELQQAKVVLDLACYPGAVAQRGRVAGVDVMADDLHARIAQLEAELRRRDAGELVRDHALAEALEQQTATAEMLRVIASSPGPTYRALDATESSSRGLMRSECGAHQAGSTRGSVPARRLDGSLRKGSPR